MTISFAIGRLGDDIVEGKVNLKYISQVVYFLIFVSYLVLVLHRGGSWAGLVAYPIIEYGRKFVS